MSKQGKEEQIKKLDELKGKVSDKNIQADIKEKQKYHNKPINK